MASYFLPNLYVPGAGKAGTSTLHELLNVYQSKIIILLKEYTLKF